MFPFLKKYTLLHRVLPYFKICTWREHSLIKELCDKNLPCDILRVHPRPHFYLAFLKKRQLRPKVSLLFLLRFWVTGSFNVAIPDPKFLWGLLKRPLPWWEIAPWSRGFHCVTLNTLYHKVPKIKVYIYISLIRTL